MTVTKVAGQGDAGGGEASSTGSKQVNGKSKPRGPDEKTDTSEGGGDSSSCSGNSSRLCSSAEELAKSSASSEAVKSSFASSDESIKSTASSLGQPKVSVQVQGSESAQDNAKSNGATSSSCSTGQANSAVSLSEHLHRSLAKSVSAETHASVSTANGKLSMSSLVDDSDSEKAKATEGGDYTKAIIEKCAEILMRDRAAMRSYSHTSTSDRSPPPSTPRKKLPPGERIRMSKKKPVALKKPSLRIIMCYVLCSSLLSSYPVWLLDPNRVLLQSR